MQIDLSPPDLDFLYLCVLTLCLYAGGLTHLTMAVHVPFIKDQYKRRRRRNTLVFLSPGERRELGCALAAHSTGVTHWALVTHVLAAMSRPPSERRALPRY